MVTETETGVRTGAAAGMVMKSGECRRSLHLTTNIGSALFDNDERNTSQQETLTKLQYSQWNNNCMDATFHTTFLPTPRRAQPHNSVRRRQETP